MFKNRQIYMICKSYKLIYFYRDTNLNNDEEITLRLKKNINNKSKSIIVN